MFVFCSHDFPKVTKKTSCYQPERNQKKAEQTGESNRQRYTEHVHAFFPHFLFSFSIFSESQEEHILIKKSARETVENTDGGTQNTFMHDLCFSLRSCLRVLFCTQVPTYLRVCSRVRARDVCSYTIIASSVICPHARVSDFNLPSERPL